MVVILFLFEQQSHLDLENLEEKEYKGGRLTTVLERLILLSFSVCCANSLLVLIIRTTTSLLMTTNEPQKKIAKGERSPDAKTVMSDGPTFSPSPVSLVFHGVGILRNVMSLVISLDRKRAGLLASVVSYRSQGHGQHSRHFQGIDLNPQ
jgi:hypothetical protein